MSTRQTVDALTLAKAVIDREVRASKPEALNEISTESLWQLAQVVEDLACRSEVRGFNATALRRVAVRVGEIALNRR